ncbi:MAG: hypothetical protein ACO3JL_02495 [Myxococcota bacterium]
MTRAPAYEPGPRERALEELWRATRYRLHSPRHLWSWFDLRRRYELRFLRVGAMKIEVPAGLLPDCESCVELCCTGPNAIVSLRLSDIAALCDRGLEGYIAKERPASTKPAPTWARWEADVSVFHRVFPVLRRDGTGTCALLTEDRHCGAWPGWPLSCARYPYALDALRGRVFLAKGCRSHRLVTIDDVPGSVRSLVENTVRAYNERVKDIILLHLALPELHELGFLDHLSLEGRLESQWRALQRAEHS